jgi:hypothetical protein
MANNRLLHHGGRCVLRSPVLKCRPSLRVLPVGGEKALRQLARNRELWPFRSECWRKTEVDMFKSKGRRWRTDRGQRHCAGRHGLRARQGHDPCRPRQAAGRWCGRG